MNCTATVITDDAGKNSKRELAVTAGHCLESAHAGTVFHASDLMFAPEWHNGQFPYGKWGVKSFKVDSRWIKCNSITDWCSENPAYDYAVIILVQHNGHGVGHYTGSDGWKISMPPRKNVRVVGIPGNDPSPLVSITESTTSTTTCSIAHRKASTPSFGDGASGGPWFYSFKTSDQLGNLLGVTGGCQEGGASDTPSYAAVWHYSFAKVVANATKHE